MNPNRTSRDLRRLVHLATLALVVVASTAAPVLAQPAVEVKRLTALLNKLPGDHAATLQKAQGRYGAAISKLNLAGLNAEINRLFGEEQTQIYKLFEPAKVKAIDQKYEPEMRSLTRQIKERQAELAQLNKQLTTKQNEIQTEYNAKITKLDPSEEKLENQLAKVFRDRRNAVAKFLDSKQLATATAEFQASIDRLTLQQAVVRKVTKQLNSEIAKVNKAANARLAKLDNAEFPLEVRLEQLVARSELEIANTLGVDEKARVELAYQPKIDTLKEAIRFRDLERAAVNQQRAADIAALQAQYAVEFTIPELVAQIEALAIEEYAALVLLVAAADVQAIEARFQPAITALQEKLQIKTSKQAELIAARDASLAVVQADYGPKIAKLQTPEERLDFKLVRLQEQRWAEIMQLADPGKIRAIQDKYEPHIARRTQELANQQQQWARATQAYQVDVNRINNNFQAEQARLQRLLEDARARMRKR